VVALTRYYLLLATPLAVGLSVLSRPLIGFLADPRYHAGSRLVPLVAVGTLCAGLATRYTLGLTFRKRTGLLSLCYVGAAVVNVGLNLVLVPRFGYMAAAASNLLSFVVLLILTRAVSRRLFAWPFPRTAAIKVGVGVSVMGLAVWFVTRPIGHPGVQLAVGVPVGIATYVLAILSLHVLRPGERAALARLVGRPPASEPPGP
jgi:O-antigen/teichoic acid export membrane protein